LSRRGEESERYGVAEEEAWSQLAAIYWIDGSNR
jgi:hypothetical protein